MTDLTKGATAVRMGVDLGSLKLPNPVMTASGTFGYGLEFSRLVDLSRLGAIVVKGLSLEPVSGHPKPRLVETAGGVLNAIGLQNVGVQFFAEHTMPLLLKTKARVIANCFGKSVEEFSEVVSRLSCVEGLAAIELNISCPNKKEWGKIFATDPDLTREVVQEARKKTALPLIVKLSPNVTDITEFARIAEAEGADALTVINTLVGMAVDLKSRKPLLSHGTGGLSGPAIKPVALWMVWTVSQAVKIPVIGAGGIVGAEDALEFLLVGAKAVQVGTANLLDPTAPLKVLSGMESYLKKIGTSDVNDFSGTLER
jgi:dihydroorotate dehydrogenase (NAD+) catalytic subunit